MRPYPVPLFTVNNGLLEMRMLSTAMVHESQSGVIVHIDGGYFDPCACERRQLYVGLKKFLSYEGIRFLSCLSN